MNPVRYPSLYQINTRVWLTGLSRALGRPATLDDVTDTVLDGLQEKGFDWIWLLSIWQTGPLSRAVSRSHADWRREFTETLPDLREDDITGSGFAIASYTVHRDFGGDAALARLRERLQSRSLRLMLDFVPNHTGLDHPWVEDHPEYFMAGSELELTRAPHNYIWAKRRRGDRLLAHGRDPHFPGWPDTLQLNYANPAAQEAMMGELLRISGQCDGVRCDMAMLVLPEVFARTWQLEARPFWPEAIRRVRARTAGFCFMAEVYWELEWTMQQQGFDYAYDKCLYDRLRAGHAGAVRGHLQAGLDYQDKLARFLENHDEPRAAATFAADQHAAAAALSFLSPGLRFFHQGQFEGRLKRISPHLGRAPEEPAQAVVAAFYHRLLGVLQSPALRQGRWQLLECGPAFDGNESSGNFIAGAWQEPGGERLLVAVNYSAQRGQCRVRLPFSDLAGRPWRLQDLLGDACYERAGDELLADGLYLDVGPWQYHLFQASAP